MYISFIILFIVLALIIIFKLKKASDTPKKKAPYSYHKRKYLMNRHEAQFFKALHQALGDQYHIFPQIHLSTVLNHKIEGQNWSGAFRHINGKSVDFVLCEPTHLSPVLAIELDGTSHQKPSRQKRDEEVERVFEEAQLPLLRISNSDEYDTTVLAKQVTDAINHSEGLS